MNKQVGFFALYVVHAVVAKELTHDQSISYGKKFQIYDDVAETNFVEHDQSISYGKKFQGLHHPAK